MRRAGLPLVLAGLGVMLAGPPATAMLPAVDAGPAHQVTTSTSALHPKVVAESTPSTRTVTTEARLTQAEGLARIPHPAHRVPVARQVAERGHHANLLVTPFGAERIHVVGTRRGRMAVPRGVHDVGLLGGSTVPGRGGTAFLAGHVDTGGGSRGVHSAALYELHRVRVGQHLRTRWRGHWRRWDVVRVRMVTHLPAGLLTPRPGRRLVVTTCGGPLVKHRDGKLHWSKHVLVTAVPHRGGAR